MHHPTKLCSTLQHSVTQPPSPEKNKSVKTKNETAFLLIHALAVLKLLTHASTESEHIRTITRRIFRLILISTGWLGQNQGANSIGLADAKTSFGFETYMDFLSLQDKSERNLVREYKWDPSELLGLHLAWVLGGHLHEEVTLPLPMWRCHGAALSLDRESRHSPIQVLHHCPLHQPQGRTPGH